MAKQGTREEAEAWLKKFHSCGDSLVISSLKEVYSKNCVLKFGNRDEIKGYRNIEHYFESTFSSLESMKHHVIHFEPVGDTIYQAADIVYIAKDDPEHRAIQINGMANYFRLPAGEEEGGKLVRFEVYLDPTPLAERMKEVSVIYKE